MRSQTVAITAALALAAAHAQAQAMLGFRSGTGSIQGQNELNIQEDLFPTLRDESNRQLNTRLDVDQGIIPGTVTIDRSPRLATEQSSAALDYASAMTVTGTLARLETNWHATVDPSEGTRSIAVRSNINDRINLQLFSSGQELEIALGYELDADLPGDFDIGSFVDLDGQLSVDAAQENRQIDLFADDFPGGASDAARFVAEDDNVGLEMNISIELRTMPDPPSGPFDPASLSGRFWVEVRVVPSPGALAVLPLGLLAARRRR